MPRRLQEVPGDESRDAVPGAGGRVLVQACGVGARRHRSPRLVEQVEGGLRVGGLRDAVVEDEEEGDVRGRRTRLRPGRLRREGSTRCTTRGPLAYHCEATN